MNRRTVIALVILCGGAVCLLVALGGVAAVFSMFGDDDDDGTGGSGGSDDGTDDGTDDDTDGEDEGEGEGDAGGDGDGEGEDDATWVKPIVFKAYSSYDCSGTPIHKVERSPPFIEDCGDMPVTTTKEYAQKLRCEANAEKVPRSTVKGEFPQWDRTTNEDNGEICCIEIENVNVSGVHDAKVTPALVSAISNTVLNEAKYHHPRKDVDYTSNDKHGTYTTTSINSTEDERKCMKNYLLKWSARL